MKFSFELPPDAEEEWEYEGERKYITRLAMIAAMRSMDFNPTANIYRIYGADFNNAGLIHGTDEAVCKLGDSMIANVRDWMDRKLLSQLQAMVGTITEFRCVPIHVINSINNLIEPSDPTPLHMYHDTIKELLILTRGFHYLRDGNKYRRPSDEHVLALPEAQVKKFSNMLTRIFSMPAKASRNTQTTVEHYLDVVELAVRLGYDHFTSPYDIQTNNLNDDLFEYCFSHSNTYRKASKTLSQYSHLTVAEAVCLSPDRTYPQLASSKAIRASLDTMRFLSARYMYNHFVQI